MGKVCLRRIEPTRNMARFYSLRVQPTLFGDWALVREWGRMGQAGQVRTELFPSHGAADLALARVFREKVGRGYRPALQASSGP